MTEKKKEKKRTTHVFGKDNTRYLWSFFSFLHDVNAREMEIFIPARTGRERESGTEMRTDRDRDRDEKSATDRDGDGDRDRDI